MDNSKNPDSRKALGRGLSALIGNPAPSTTVANVPKQEIASSKSSFLSHELPKNLRFEEVELSKIDANPDQPRKQFNQARLEELALSLKERGLVQPIVVKDSQNGRYLIIAGERRFRAAKLAGFDKIPAIVRNDNFEVVDNDLASLVENIQREELGPIELATAYERMIRQHNFTQETLAQKLGMSRVTLANTLRLLKLPDAIREMVSQRLLSEGHSRALLQLDNEIEMMKLANEIVEGGLTVRDVEMRVRMRAQANIDANNPSRSGSSGSGNSGLTQNAELKSLEEELQRLMGTKIALRGNAAKGSIEIYFSGKDSLNRIVHQLRSLQS